MELSAREYHDRTKHSPERLAADDFSLDWANKPRPWKVYEDLPAVPLADRIRPSGLPALRAVAESDREPLPADHPDRGAARPVDLDALTQLCYLAAGVTKRIRRGGDTRLFRAAACTGALYHVDLYLVTGDVPPAPWTDGGGDGIDPGVYHFDPRTNSLDVLREGDYRGVVTGASGGHGQAADAPVTVVATSTWWRNAWKYRGRTYRHAFWDSGTVLANLLAAAHGLDLPAAVVTGFADGPVVDLLGLDVEGEAPVALVPVGRGDPAPDPPAVEAIDPTTRPLSGRVVEYPEIPAAYRASTLESGDDARAWRERSAGGDGGSRGAGDGDAGDAGASVGTRPAGDGERVGLEPVGDDRAAKTPLFHAVRRRGSCREYARESLNRRKVSTVLDRAVRGPPMDCRDAGGPALQYNDCYLVVNAVDGLQPGAYHYHPDAGELELLRAGEFREEARHLALDQRLAGDAALCAFFLTDLDAVVDRLGDRGYRAAQLEAALTAGRLYLAAYAHRDLGATGLTFFDDEVTAFFEPRAAGQTPTFCWTLGRPA